MVVFYEEMPIRSENEGDIHPLAARVEFGLLQGVIRREVFGFGFDERHGDGLAAGGRFDTEDIVLA